MQYCLISTTVKILVLIVPIFSKNFSTNGPYVFLNFANLGEKPSLIENVLYVKSEILYYLPILWSLFSESLVLGGP